MVNDVGPLQIGVQRVYSMMEGFWLMVELAAQSAHPVDVELSVAHVKGLWVVKLAEVLTFNKSVEDAIHWYFCLEALVRAPKALNNRVLLFLKIGTVSLPLGKLGGGQVLEGTTYCAVTETGRACVLQEISLVTILTFRAAEVELRHR